MKKRIYPALPVFAPKLAPRLALFGASLFVLAVCGLSGAQAQDAVDIGIPADGVASPTPVEAPQVDAAPAPVPVVVEPQETPAASSGAVVVTPPVVPSSTPVAPSVSEVQTQPIAQPVEEPKGEELASPASEVQVVSPAPATPGPVSPAKEAVKVEPAKPQGITKAEAGFDEDLFYDAKDVVPEGELAKKSARKVNPKLEPGSKLIVVTRDSGPGSPQAQLVSAGRALKLGRYDAALDIYQALYEKNRRDPQVLMGVAVALQRMGNFEASIAAYQELLDIQPKNIGAEVNMLGLMSEKYPAVAVRRLEELRVSNPSDLGVVAQLAVTQAQLNNTQEALKYLAVAASMQPDNPGHVYNMAIIADRAGNRKEAVQYYEQALEMDSVYGGGRSLPRDVIFERLARLR
jgi:Flp pilus assembly protein TadD